MNNELCSGGCCLHNQEPVPLSICGQQEAIAKATQTCDREHDFAAHAWMNGLGSAQFATAGSDDHQYSFGISGTACVRQPRSADCTAVVQAEDAQVLEDSIDELDWQLRHIHVFTRG